MSFYLGVCHFILVGEAVAEDMEEEAEGMEEEAAAVAMVVEDRIMDVVVEVEVSISACAP